METPSRRDLLAGLAALPAVFSRNLLGLVAPGELQTGAEQPPVSSGPGTLQINTPSQSVVRRG
jgi:hypothetical protein